MLPLDWCLLWGQPVPAAADEGSKEAASSATTVERSTSTAGAKRGADSVEAADLGLAEDEVSDSYGISPAFTLESGWSYRIAPGWHGGLVMVSLDPTEAPPGKTVLEIEVEGSYETTNFVGVDEGRDAPAITNLAAQVYVPVPDDLLSQLVEVQNEATTPEVGVPVDLTVQDPACRFVSGALDPFLDAFKDLPLGGGPDEYEQGGALTCRNVDGSGSVRYIVEEDLADEVDEWGDTQEELPESGMVVKMQVDFADECRALFLPDRQVALGSLLAAGSC